MNFKLKKILKNLQVFASLLLILSCCATNDRRRGSCGVACSGITLPATISRFCNKFPKINGGEQ